MGSLRFALALSVVLCHLRIVYGLNPMEGWISVEGFFVISGFYMAMVLSDKYPATGAGNAIFYFNRFTRLYPAYMAVWLLTALALLLIGAPAINTHSITHIWSEMQVMDVTSVGFIVISNLTMIGTDLVSFLGDVGHDLAYIPTGPDSSIAAYHYLLIPQGWTLGLELTFYAFAPFLLRLKPRWIALVALVSLTIRLALPHVFHLSIDCWGHAFFPSVLYLFLLGALAIKLKIGREFLLDEKLIVGAWAGLILYIALFQSLPGSESLRYWILIGLLTILLFPLFHYSRDIAWDRFLGELSYPLYLCHLFVEYVVDHTLGPSHMIFKLVGSIAMAAGIYLLIDRNVDTLRVRLVERMKAGQPLFGEKLRPAFARIFVAPFKKAKQGGLP